MILWAVLIDGPDDEDVHVPRSCMEEAVTWAEDCNGMFRAFRLTRYAQAVRWVGAADDHARLMRDGVPGWT